MFNLINAFTTLFSQAVDAHRERARRKREMNAFLALNDHTLRDIGLSRSDLARVTVGMKLSERPQLTASRDPQSSDPARERSWQLHLYRRLLTARA